jgi:hypothetical protein
MKELEEVNKLLLEINELEQQKGDKSDVKKIFITRIIN